MSSNMIAWKTGVIDGIPIFLGYVAVSFTFGIMAKSSGLTTFQAVTMSLLNFTSAGQFAALGLITASSSYIEMAVTQLALNLRYSLMSCSLSQKLDSTSGFLHRIFIAHGISDEIFGVSISKDGKLNPFYNYGLMSASLPGWVLGTYLGVVSGSILPDRVISALSIALYGMFIAVVIPPAKGNKQLASVIFVSMVMSFLFSTFIHITSGFKIVILTIVVAGLAARLFPVYEEN
jgi:predicted branched-subunit amino acid permease